MSTIPGEGISLDRVPYTLSPNDDSEKATDFRHDFCCSW